jgi:hypothetical protein
MIYILSKLLFCRTVFLSFANPENGWDAFADVCAGFCGKLLIQKKKILKYKYFKPEMI